LTFIPGAFLLLSCAMPTTAGVAQRIDVVTTHPSAPPIAPSTTCDVTTATEPALSRNHHAPCSEIDYPFVPPASGDHYDIWADYRTYDAPVPWGFLVHSMEHGAVVLAYEPSSVAAADVRAAFTAVIAAHGADPICRDETWMSRIIVVPAHDLDVPIAAMAWEHTYEASCLDMPSLMAFVEAHYGHGPEDLCGPGEDASSTGWCR
jgi:hypothetical protein